MNPHLKRMLLNEIQSCWAAVCTASHGAAYSELNDTTFVLNWKDDPSTARKVLAFDRISLHYFLADLISIYLEVMITFDRAGISYLHSKEMKVDSLFLLNELELYLNQQPGSIESITMTRREG